MSDITGNVCVCGFYVVIDQIEDPEERAKQEAAKNFVGTSSHVGKPSADTAADNDERISDTEEVSCPSKPACSILRQYSDSG